MMEPDAWGRVVSSASFLMEHLQASAHHKILNIAINNNNSGMILGVLYSIKDLVERRMILRAQVVATANVMSSILEQAEHLLENEYKDAACVLAGGALETLLRSMRENLTTDDSKAENLGKLNDLLFKNNIYDKITHGHIRTWAKLRNDAAHGHYDAVKKDQVEEFLRFIKSFTSGFATPIYG